MTKPKDSTMVRRLSIAAKRQRDATHTLRATIREAAEAGMSYRAIGRAAGMTYQRVHQLVKGDR